MFLVSEVFPFAKFYISLSEEKNFKLELKCWHVVRVGNNDIFAVCKDVILSLHVVTSYSDHLYDNPYVHCYSPQPGAKPRVSF